MSESTGDVRVPVGHPPGQHQLGRGDDPANESAHKLSPATGLELSVWGSLSALRNGMTTEPHDSDAEFARLLRDAHRELFGFIFAMLQNRADAEDVYQQTALVLWRKFATFEPGTNFVAWAIRVAQFEIKDFVKARRRRKVFFNDEILDAIAAQYQAESNEYRERRLEALGKCVEKLSERDRGLLDRCYAVERDYRKIARTEGKTISAIYQSISRIRKALYQCVQRSLAAAE
jgi:RNA polymerase sigma-70 factor (ECF subfamily)